MNEKVDIDGWLSPDGKMTECGSAEHTISAEQIIKERYGELHRDRYDYLHQPDDILTKLGWIKKCSEKNYLLGYGWFPEQVKITPAQSNYIYFYCLDRDCLLPSWWEKVEVE